MKTVLPLRLLGLLLLVTVGTTTAQAQRNDLKIRIENQIQTRIDDIIEEKVREGSNYDYDWRIKTRSDARTRRNIPLTRRSRRVLNKGSVWNRNWLVDKYYPRRGTDNFINVYLGLNNYLEDGDLPDSDALFNLKPLGSWYAALNFDNISHIIGPLYMDWGAGFSMQDFSFENTRTRLVKTDQGISFEEDTDVVGRRSKINLTYINVHFVPTISFGRYSSFRMGVGVYGGYKLSSNVKYKYEVNGDTQKDKFSDNFFVNPFRYGIRAQIGWDFFDLFFNYDMSELFEDDKIAPRLNPVTFGVIL